MNHNHDKPKTPTVDSQKGKDTPSSIDPEAEPMSSVHKPTLNKANEMNYSYKQQGDNPSMGMEGHNHHAMMTADFKKRFNLLLILTVPIMVLSAMIQKFIGVDWQFTGSKYILLALSSVVFFYGGWPFFKGLVTEIKTKTPGMMFLIGFAITAAYVYSVADVFGLKGEDFFWELATLILIMLLGHWIEMKTIWIVLLPKYYPIRN